MCADRRPSLTRLLGTRNAADLNILLNSELSLSETTVGNCNNAVKKFTEFLKNKFQEKDFSFREIIMGGSLGTHTEINSEDDVDVSLHIMLGYADADLLENVAKFKDNLPKVIEFLKACVEEYGDCIEIDEMSKQMIDCTLSIQDCPVDVEISMIPSLYWDVADETKREELYDQMIENVADRRYYTTSLCALHNSYVNELNNNRVRNLIRLAKFWRQRAFSDEKQGSKFPTAYMLQALVISLWERAGRPETFKPSVGFKAMMEEIEHYNDMHIIPKVYFSQEKVQRGIVSLRQPVLVDPCDPTRNLAAECNCWNDVATVAIATLGKPMVEDVVLNPRWQ